MTLTAEQYSDMAATCEDAAADMMVPPQQRASFAKKADYFRLVAKLAAKQKAAIQASNSSSKQAADPPLRSDDRVPPNPWRPSKRGAKVDPEIPAPQLALMHLALRWRLFRLTTETFRRPEISDGQPLGSSPPQH